MTKKLLIVASLLLGVFISVQTALAANYDCLCKNLVKAPIIDADEFICQTQCTKYCESLKSTMDSCTIAANQVTTVPTATIVGQSPIKLTNPLSVDSPQQLIGKVINSVLGLVGSIALLMFVIGGLTWMTSSGNPEKVKKGRDIIVWSAIGLVIIFLAYALIRFVLATVTK